MILISDKVVCVNDADQTDDLVHIKNGEIYVVREIVSYDHGIGLRLVGLRPNETYYRGKMVESAWNILRFRKLADIKAESARHVKSDLNEKISNGGNDTKQIYMQTKKQTRAAKAPKSRTSSRRCLYELVSVHKNYENNQTTSACF